MKPHINPFSAGPNACCLHNAQLSGHSKNGVQRYKCGLCGGTWSDPNRKIGGNNVISESKIAQIKALAVRGRSLRVIAQEVQVHKNTVMRYIRRIPKSELPSRLVQSPRDFRHRGQYLKKYYASHRYVNSYHRIRWRDILRAYIQRILAESPRPMTTEEVHRIVVIDFHDVKLFQVGYILNANCEDTFKSVGTYWTYKLPEFFVYHDGWPKDSLIARAAWHARYGIEDTQKTFFEHQKRTKETEKAIANARPALQLLMAASTIRKLYDHQNDCPPAEQQRTPRNQ